MTAIEFAYLLNNPELITPKQAQDIEKLRYKFPFLQCAAALNLKELYKKNSFGYNNELKKVAALTADRTILFDFITSDMFLAKVVPSKDKKNKAFELLKEDIEPTIKQGEMSKNEEVDVENSLGISLSKVDLLDVPSENTDTETLENKEDNAELQTDHTFVNNLSEVSENEDVVLVAEQEAFILETPNENLIDNQEKLEASDTIIISENQQQETTNHLEDAQKESGNFISDEILSEDTTTITHSFDDLQILDTNVVEATESVVALENTDEEKEFSIENSEEIQEQNIHSELLVLEQIMQEESLQEIVSQDVSEQDQTELYHDFIHQETQPNEGDLEPVSTYDVDLNKNYSELILEALSDDYQEDTAATVDYFYSESESDLELTDENQTFEEVDYSYLYPEIPETNTKEQLENNSLENNDLYSEEALYNDFLVENKVVVAENQDTIGLLEEYQTETYYLELEEEISLDNQEDSLVQIASEEEVVETILESKTNIDASAAIEEKLEIGKPLTFEKQDVLSFDQWLQTTKIKPIVRENEPENLILLDEQDIEEDNSSDSFIEEDFVEQESPQESNQIVSEEAVVDTISEENDSNRLTEEEKENEVLREKLKKIAIIDRFIEANPKIVADKNAPLAPPLEEPAYDQATLMTETLARVYLEQKKFQKAIDAYEILILKYPEKSVIFADKIKNIKKLQQNNK